ncbi:hypothetical protein EK21DRAFT_63237, partial [Setomelanomma holmii]
YFPLCRVNPAKLYPKAMREYHRFSPRDGEKYYKKHQDFLPIVVEEGDMSLFKEDLITRLTVREINVCELMRTNPHTNVAKYRGAVCRTRMEFDYRGKNLTVLFDTERVYKLVFKKYDCDLWDLVKEREQFDARHCLESLAAGIKHFHALGVVHCDIKPDNIFVDLSGKRPVFVVGDFDSTQMIGAVYNLKGGARGWGRNKRHGHDLVEKDDDWYGFQNVKQWLIRETGARSRDLDGIGRISRDWVG